MSDAAMTDRLGPLRQALAVLGAYVVLEVVLVSMAFLWVFIYSVAIYSEGDQAHYEAYAQVSSPVVAVLLAGPVFFLVARWMRGRWPGEALRMALATCVLGLVVGATLVILGEVENLAFSLTMVVLATATTAAGAVVGARPPA